MISHNKHIAITGVMIFWLVIIISYVAINEYTLSTGKELMLKTVPVDPRDIFRGDYVILKYDISDINFNEIKKYPLDLTPGERVYVKLTEINGYVQATAIERTRPTELYISGNIVFMDENKASIEYGIESYFIPENKGKEIENTAANNRNLEVKIKLNKYGSAAIEDLYLDGKKVEFK